MDNASGPIEPAVRATMNAVAEVLDKTFNPDHVKGSTGLSTVNRREYGFALLVFRFTAPDVIDPRMNWISNAARADMLCALKEMVANMEGRAHAAPERPQ